MKKIFNFMMIALVAMVAFTSCSEDCNHDYIEVDYSKKLAGTWTCIEPENAYAEALVINADGSVTSTGVFDGQLWEKKGSIKIKDNKMTLSFEDGDNIETRFEMVEGVAFSLVDDELDVRYDYYYCKNDLADEVVGMWVCTYVPWMDADMAINTYQADGKALFTGFVGNADFDYASNVETTYKVIGDLMIQTNPMSYEGAPKYLAFRLDYAPNGSEYGDVLTNTNLMLFGDEVIETTASMIRVKQNLNLTGKRYEYSATYLSNVKGEDKDIPFFDSSINFAKLDEMVMDMFLNTTLFSVHFPNANTLEYGFRMNGGITTTQAPIVVEGNKMTIKMSANNAAYRDVVVYAYQDQDDSQFHMYMPTTSFENFFGNMQVELMDAKGQLDLTDEAAVKAVFDSIEAAVESINFSIVMK